MDIDINFISNLKKLKKLRIQNCKVYSLSAIGMLSMLIFLELSKLSGYRGSLSFLKTNVWLEFVSLRMFNQLKEIPDFYKGGENIRKVQFHTNRPKLVDLKSLTTCENLEALVLTISDDLSFEDILPVLQLQSLKYIRIVSLNDELIEKVSKYCLIQNIKTDFNIYEV